MPTEQLAQGFSAQLAKPNLATVIGLLKEAIDDVEAGRIVYQYEEVDEEKEDEAEMEEKDVKSKNRNWFNDIFQITRNWFNAETDTEF